MIYTPKQCLFCGTDERLVQLYPRTFEDRDLTPEVFSARRMTEHFHYAVVRCERCGLVFSREILPEDALAKLYSRSSVTFGEYTDVLRKDYWRCLHPYAAGLQGGRALEIGCSTGFFLEELLARGCAEVHGCEPSVEARERAHPVVRGQITQGLFRKGMYPVETFDLVCSFHTLDHMSDPADAVGGWFDLLKPGGIAYTITHDVRSLQARLLGERSPIIDVEHVYLFDRATLRRLFERAGFAVVALSDVRNSYPLDYWMKMLPLRQPWKTALRKVLKRCGAGPIPVPLKAGNIFIIARRPESV
jgi:SAM-dependent methyltransferase